MNIDDGINLEKARSHEAERRLKLLGETAGVDYDYDQIRKRARRVDIQFKYFIKWWRAYRDQGMEGLIPQNWTELDEKTWSIVIERYNELGELADAEMVTSDQIARLAARNGYSTRTANRWLRRYRVGGLWALAPGNDPFTVKKHNQNPPRDIGALEEADLEVMYERRDVLGDLADRISLSNALVESRSRETGVSSRTIWDYFRDYRRYGLAGLAPRERSDKGSRRGISKRMEKRVKKIRLHNKDWSVAAVYEEACRRARVLGEFEPSEWQVRDICEKIPEFIRLIADGRRPEFNNRFRITYPMKFNGMVYQIDHTLVDVIIVDIRSKKYRSKSGQVRPHLTLAMDSKSRLVMGAQFGYEAADRFRVAATIRDCLVTSEEKPFGGIPDQIWVDNGRELISNHVRGFTREIGIKLEPGRPHLPQHRGIVERFFGTLNTRLWSRLPGYVGSNTVERNPSAKAELTLVELVGEFWEFIDRYHNEVHSVVGKTPVEYWMDNCFAESVEPGHLAVLLKERKTRRVIKKGIRFKNRFYWDKALAGLVGQDVLIRVGPSYVAPDDIEVFHDGRWVCTAYAIDSKMGKMVTRGEIAAAQREQLQIAKDIIDGSEDAGEETDQEIKEQNESVETPDPPQDPPKSDEQKPKKRRSDFLDYLADLDQDDDLQ